MASKVVFFMAIACLSLALIRVESRRGETFLERVQRAYTQANSNYPVRKTEFTNYQIPEGVQEPVLPQRTREHGWDLKKGTNPAFRPQELNDKQTVVPKVPNQSTAQPFTHHNTIEDTTRRFPESNYRQHETREAAVHHTIPASLHNNDREETVRNMGAQELEKAEIAGYMRPDATTRERVQSTFMRQDAAREEAMPQEFSRETTVRHTMPESIPQGWSHAKHTNPTFMPQGTYKWAQTEQRTLPTSRPQYTARHTWAQQKRATTTAMLDGMGEGGDK